MRFIILVPHRDALKPLEEYRQRLFAAGFYGAYSFPLSAILAEVSRPFNREELKTLAGNIRSRMLLNPGKNEGKNEGKNDGNKGGKNDGKNDGKIICNSACMMANASQMSFFGPPLNLPVSEGVFPDSANDKLLCMFNPPVLCTALAAKSPAKDMVLDKNLLLDKNLIIEETVSFRAAYTANLALRQLDGEGFSLEWKSGEPVWLPNARASVC